MPKKEIIIPERYKYIGVFLTMRCPLDCSYCANLASSPEEFSRRKFNELSGEEWTYGLNRIVSRPEVPITFSGGEPMVHKDFIYILNNLKPELKIDISTNLQWGKKVFEEFIRKVSPERIKRNAPYPSIRVSYHPEQMKEKKEEFLHNVKRLQDRGFSIGIESVMYPSNENLLAIEQIAVDCRNLGISFRPKSFFGKFEGKIYGNFSTYPDACFQEKTHSGLCQTSELLIGPNGNVYRCHHDLYLGKNSVGSILDEEYQIKDISRNCKEYGKCNPCDVKDKSDSKQKLNHTSVEITNLST